MSKAKAIYQWWKKLPLWVRIPLSIVLVAALFVLVIELALRVFRPSRSIAYTPATSARIELQERDAEALKEAMGKSDKRMLEIKKEIERENNTLRDNEKDIADCDSIDCVDGIIARYTKRARDRREREDND
jgi:septal ring factor EnvC (AmiA/AmiB activator)